MNLLTNSHVDRTALEKRQQQQELQNNTRKGLRTNEMFTAYVAQFYARSAGMQQTTARCQMTLSEISSDSEKRPIIMPLSESAENFAGMQQRQRHDKGARKAYSWRIHYSYYTAELNIEAMACSYVLQKYIEGYEEKRLRGHHGKPVVFVLPNNYFLIYSPQEQQACSTRVGRVPMQLSPQIVHAALEGQSNNYLVQDNKTQPAQDNYAQAAIIASSPEELYDKVISVFSPAERKSAKDEFLSEFYAVKELITINYESEKQRFSF